MKREILFILLIFILLSSFVTAASPDNYIECWESDDAEEPKTFSLSHEENNDFFLVANAILGETRCGGSKSFVTYYSSNANVETETEFYLDGPFILTVDTEAVSTRESEAYHPFSVELLQDFGFITSDIGEVSNEYYEGEIISFGEYGVKIHRKAGNTFALGLDYDVSCEEDCDFSFFYTGDDDELFFFSLYQTHIRLV